MKVCTDACIFGAIIDANAANKILDIGTGTGLLSLMVAQKSNAKIIAIEIDNEAASQAQENIKNSLWASDIQVFNQSIQSFAKEYKGKFDLIVSNPPFFMNNLKSSQSAKNKAKHDDSLKLEELALCVNQLLTENGFLWVLLPEYEMSILEKLLKNHSFNCIKKYILKNRQNEEQNFRIVASFSKVYASKIIEDTIVIYENDMGYTPELKMLLKEYYLYL